MRNSSYSSYGIFMKLSQNDGHQMLQRILSGFCDSIFYQGVIALVLNLHFWASVCNSSSVRNSSYSSYVIWTKLSQNDCVQVRQCILSMCVCESVWKKAQWRGIWLSLTALVQFKGSTFLVAWKVTFGTRSTDSS